MEFDIFVYSGLEIRDSILNGDYSAVDVAEFFLSRIERYNSMYNAVVSVNPDWVGEAEAVDRMISKGVVKPLTGIPILVKDNIETRGIRTTYGSILYKDYIPEFDALIVERLREAGAIILGKTNLSEFGLVAITDNPLFGATRNPWDLSRTPGGSSGGSATSVAVGFSPISIGNDAGGSIRIPSAFCGVIGFKPSYGLVPAYPKPGYFQGLYVDGPIARSILDIALIMDVIAGPDMRDKDSLGISKPGFVEGIHEDIEKVRIGYSPDLGYSEVSPEVEEKVRDAVYRFEELGFEVEEVKADLFDIGRYLTIKTAVEFYHFIRAKLEEWREVAFKPYLKLIELAMKTSLQDYLDVESRSEELWRRIMKIFKEYDFLVTPTTAVTAFKHEDGLGPREINGRKVGPLGWMPFTYPFNFTGQPAISIPVGMDREGLPIGMQVVGEPYRDLDVLRLAYAYEKNFIGRLPRPPNT